MFDEKFGQWVLKVLYIIAVVLLTLQLKQPLIALLLIAPDIIYRF